MNLLPRRGASIFVMDVPAPVGRIQVWAPEAICSHRGNSAVYPAGMGWHRDGEALHQAVSVEQSNGPGNAPKIDPQTYECCGIRIAVDEPVSWETSVTPIDGGVEFRIRVRNEGARPLLGAGAPVCVKFLGGHGWWSDDVAFVRTGGHIRPLSALGRDAGQPNEFQAYLLEGETYDNPFFREFWGINRHRLERPAVVSRCEAAGRSVVVEARSAYMMHSNRGNPCTDMLLKLGDLPPGGVAEERGRVRVVDETPERLLR